MATESVATSAPASGAVEYVQIPAEAIPDLRWALALGLHELCEIKRVREEWRAEKEYGEGIPDRLKGLRPITASAADDDLTRFTSALLWLEHARPVEA